ncbi:hypothetical protein U1Q18_025889 [Sarracenia purpurea var. burkii]
MAVKMMKWRPWPPKQSKKFEAKIVVCRLKGLRHESSEKGSEIEEFSRLAVEIKWKGSKGNGLNSLRRTGLNQGPINKVLAVATASLNLAEFAFVNEEKELEICIPLSLHDGSIELSPSLCVSLSILESRTGQGPLETVQRSAAFHPLSPRSAYSLSTEKDVVSALKAGLKKVKVLTGYVSARRAMKKASHAEEGSDGKSSVRSEDAESNYPFDSDSLDAEDEEESEEVKEHSRVRKSVSYGSLAFANSAGALFYSNASNSEDEDCLHYCSNRRSVVGSLSSGDLTASLRDHESSKRSILSWKRRKLSFRSSSKPKGEPLLRKDYGEEGGDDIDFDRRQRSSSDESAFGRHKPGENSIANSSSISEFGDDNFAVGSWENKEIISRDGHMKLQTQVFFASIDQRNEQAAGEGACTALVAVITDWFQSNRDQMPLKSQLDCLIREGSLEWRKLCKDSTYRERFPDKHFDLETVLEAKFQHLCLLPEKSFIGFFYPEGLEEEVEGFDFLHGAMSFDSIWDEISQFGAENPINGEPLVYIVCWNDHFFVLKVEKDAYYIVDTLGERLHEGCNRAYVLKFDKDTTIQWLSKDSRSFDDKTSSQKVQANSHEKGSSEEEESVVCRGKESCKEYIKSFLAAIPIRELQVDLKKGLMAATPLHHRLQIEFHYTRCVQPLALAQFSAIEALADALEISTLAVV